MEYLILIGVSAFLCALVYWFGKKIGALEKENSYEQEQNEKHKKYLQALSNPLRSISDVIKRMREGKL